MRDMNCMERRGGLFSVVCLLLVFLFPASAFAQVSNVGSDF